MVKEFGNSTNDASDSSFGRSESAGPSNAADRDARDNSSDDRDGDDEEDLKEDPNEELDRTETQENSVVHEG